jgi:hypothetical protein
MHYIFFSLFRQMVLELGLPFIPVDLPTGKETLRKPMVWQGFLWWQANKDIFLDLFYMIIISPFLIYIGIQRAGSPEWLFHCLIALASLIALYHLYFAYINFKKGSSTLWVNLFHLLIVAPVLFWIGYNGKTAGRYPYEIILLLGFGILGFHIYSLTLQLNTVTGGKSDF